MSDVAQWPSTTDGKVNLLRMLDRRGRGQSTEAAPRDGSSGAGARGVVVPGASWSVASIEPLPFRLRRDAAFLRAADPGSLKSMIKASFRAKVRRKAMDLGSRAVAICRFRCAIMDRRVVDESRSGVMSVLPASHI